MEITVRKLREEDIEEISRIEAASFSMPWSAAAFRDLLTRPYCTYLTALSDGRPVGCCGYTRLGEEASVDNVVVAPAYRGRGVGKTMLAALLREGQREGVKAFTLEVRESNLPARRLYERFGFVCEGVRPNFYEKPREDAAILWLR